MGFKKGIRSHVNLCFKNITLWSGVVIAEKINSTANSARRRGEYQK